MEFQLGLTELIAFAVANIGGGWALLRLSFAQFELRLNDRFELLDDAMADVKRIELEVVRADTRNAQTYVTQASHDKVLERIFNVLSSMEQKLDGKANAADFEAKLLQHMERK